VHIIKKKVSILHYALHLAFILLITALTGCFTVQHHPSPSRIQPVRSAEFVAYYAPPHEFTVSDSVSKTEDGITVRRIVLTSDAGPCTLDYFHGATPSDTAILVFPILGGGNEISEYFARYFAKAGYDSVLVHRVNDFKDPAFFETIEAVYRNNVRRDRLAINYLETQYGKKRFGSFGISRGAINIAMTAGVDERLQFNVMALGGSDLIRIIKHSEERRIDKFKNGVMEQFNLTEKEFFNKLKEKLKTDPKFLAPYIKPEDTLLVLGLLDSTVPIQYGIKLRRAIGGPKTIYLFADHYLSVGFTGLAEVPAPLLTHAPFPFDYIEEEALIFYNEKFKKDTSIPLELWPFRILQSPVNLIANLIDWLAS
jgi:hypothetical protein